MPDKAYSSSGIHSLHAPTEERLLSFRKRHAISTTCHFRNLSYANRESNISLTQKPKQSALQNIDTFFSNASFFLTNTSSKTIRYLLPIQPTTPYANRFATTRQAASHTESTAITCTTSFPMPSSPKTSATIKPGSCPTPMYSGKSHISGYLFPTTGNNRLVYKKHRQSVFLHLSKER